jgi:hypothetical protein
LFAAAAIGAAALAIKADGSVDSTGNGMGGGMGGDGMEHNHFEPGMHTTITVAAA